MTARRATTALVGVAACGLLLTACSGSAPQALPGSTAPTTGTSGPAAAAPAATAPAPAATDPAGTRPNRVRIPSIGVDSTLQDLGITTTGQLQTPSLWQRAGWFADGVRPGDTGPAVIAGHVDSREGPAVFARLTSVRAGANVLVTRDDRTVLRFVVDSVQRYPKKQFPTDAVYGPSSLPLLRLITCTGSFDRAARSYLDNLVVTTHLVAP